LERDDDCEETRGRVVEKMVKEIRDSEGTILAILLSSKFEKDGIEFFTPDNFSQQLGYMKRPAGYEIEPHVHKLVVREVSYTLETIFVKRGRLEVDLYSADKVFVATEELETGDVILLAAGGHGFRFTEESELVEIKQGPYISFEVDKERFEKPNRS